jgi:hypothetical protein
MSDQIVGHISRDATAIIGNERPVRKEKKEAKPAAKRGRPRTGEERPKEDKRIDRQIGQTFDEALKELPIVCDVGCKRSSQGYKETWIGYKLHVDTSDCGLPITAVLHRRHCMTVRWRYR